MTLAEVRAKLWRVIDDSREITNPDWAADARDVMIDAVKAIDEAHVKPYDNGYNHGLVEAARVLERMAAHVRGEYRAALADGVREVLAQRKEKP